MAMETGVSLYVPKSTIHIRKKTIYDLDRPEYIWVMINEKDRQIAIQKCEKDPRAFRLHYLEDDRAGTCYLRSKPLMAYLVWLADIKKKDISYWFSGELLSDGKTVVIDLTKYKEIAQEG